MIPSTRTKAWSKPSEVLLKSLSPVRNRRIRSIMIHPGTVTETNQGMKEEMEEADHHLRTM
jgi:hypothetical protein